MAELADAHDSKSCGVTHVGSSPTPGTIQRKDHGYVRDFLYHPVVPGKPTTLVVG